MQETWVRSLGWEDPLAKEVATYSSILAWRIPWTEPGGHGLQSLDMAEQLSLHFLLFQSLGPKGVLSSHLMSHTCRGPGWGPGTDTTDCSCL